MFSLGQDEHVQTQHEPSSATTIPQCSSVAQPPVRKTKLGPPQYIKPRAYNPILERLEQASNARLIAEYEEDVYKHFVTLEQISDINPKMIDLQPEIEWFMRPYLLDFLIEMHTSFKLKPQTLFLCMNIIDRYCSKRIVFKQHYQLIGCTAMWMAGKYEDKKSRVPTLRELSMMCRSVYDESMFKEMEMHMLSTLDWSLGHVTLEDCVQLSIKAAKRDLSMSTPNGTNNKSVESAIIAISRYLCELSLFQRSFLMYPTSLVAVTANLMASAIIDDDAASQFLSKIHEDYEYESHFGDFKMHYRYAGQKQRQNSEGSMSEIYGIVHGADNDNEEEDEDEDDEMFDEDSENTKPTPKIPFISGFQGKKTIVQIRQISLLFINAINSPSEILVNKYTPLGVINVVNTFLQKNYTFLQQSITLLNLKDMKIEELTTATFNSQLYQLSDLLLGITATLDQPRTQPITMHSAVNHSPPPPLTPSSSTSAYSSSSIFSSGLKTPNANTFMLKNTPYQQQKGFSQHQQPQRRNINYPNSSPVAELPSSPPIVMNEDANDTTDVDVEDSRDANYEHKFEKPAKPASAYYSNNYQNEPVSSPIAYQGQNMIY